MVARTNQQLGNYRLIQLLGGSEVAEVYLGEDLLFKTLVAIKIVQAPLSGQDILVLLREVGAIAGLAHPHIARILDFGVQDEALFLVMEYAPGDTLRQNYALGVHWHPAKVISLIEGLADALYYAHNQKIIHGDVRPENILFGADNEALLSDFGLATLLRTSGSQHAQPMNDAVYLAPEQLAGEPQAASDQYSLAVVAYEWLNGSLPQRAAGNVPPVPLEGAMRAISPEIGDVLHTAMERDPARRFGSVQAFAKALGQANAGEVTQTLPAELLFSPTSVALNLLPTSSQSQMDQVEVPPSQGPYDVYPSQYSGAETMEEAPMPSQPELEPQTVRGRAARKPSRRTVLIGIGSGAVLIGGMLTLVATGKIPSLFARSSPTATRLPGRNPVPRITPTLSTQPTSSPPAPLGTTLTTYTGQSSDVTGVCWSPAVGSRMVASCSQDGSLATWNALTGGVNLTLSQSGTLNTLVWSPNSQYIASGGSGNVVTIWDATNGNILTTCTGHTRPILGLAWSPNSQSIVSTSQDNSAIVWDVASGNKLVTYTGHSNYVWSVAWALDGSAVATGGWDNSVQIWNPDTGSLILNYPTNAPIRAVDWSPDSRSIASGGDDNLVLVWQVANGAVQATYQGHSNHIETVQWSPDGQQIASSSKDTTVQIWQASNANPTYTYQGHSELVWSVAWSPDGQLIVSGSQDHTAKVWQAV